MRWQLLALGLLGACHQVFGHEPPPGPDAAVDAAPPALAPWTSATSLPIGRDYNHAHAALIADTLYLIGGFTAGIEVDVVYRARVTDRVLGAWSETVPLPAPRAVGDVVTIGDRIYVVGGANRAAAQRSVYFTDASSGDILPWSATTQLTLALKAHAAAVANGNVYVVGGGDTLNIRQTAVYRARVAFDGQLGAWQPEMELPEPRANHTSVAARGFLYAIGGDDNTDFAQPTVFYAALDADTGAVGPWITTTRLPEAREGLVAVTDGHHIFVLGGGSSETSAEVLHSRIGDDGSLGPWEQNAPLLLPRMRHAGVFSNGLIFVLGGVGAQTSVEQSSQY